MTAIPVHSANKMNPKKFNLWLFLIGVVMLFTGLTSAYIVRKGDGNWFEFDLPSIFLYSTLIVVLSSLSMLYAYKAVIKDDLVQSRAALFVTMMLGIGFCISQYFGWMAMVNEGLHLVTPKDGSKVSASFVYVISFVHLAHILGGIVFLAITLWKSFKHQVHKKNTLLIDMCNTYWHFVGLLWVYLYLFLYFAR
ncbi:MAG: cytochrome c oxidase subunit 3 [Bacteroidia bacterium]